MTKSRFVSRLQPLLLACALALSATTLVNSARADVPRTEPLPDLRNAADPALQRGLEAVVSELGLTKEVANGDLAVSLVDITEAKHPRMAMLNGDEMLYAASLPKIAILLGAFVEAELGHLTLDNAHIETLTRMIRVSNNAAASEALRWIGGERLIAILESPKFKLYDPKGAGGLWVGKAYDNEGAFRRDPIHNLSHGATAFQVARFYQMLDGNALVNPTLTEKMKDVMSKPGIIHKFVAGLQQFSGLTIYRKSGSWGESHADSAMVEANGHKYIMVGLARKTQGGDWLARLAPRLHELVMASPPATSVAGLR
jgi:beta-lactamase class A